MKEGLNDKPYLEWLSKCNYLKIEFENNGVLEHRYLNNRHIKIIIDCMKNYHFNIVLGILWSQIGLPRTFIKTFTLYGYNDGLGNNITRKEFINLEEPKRLYLTLLKIPYMKRLSLIVRFG
jgi:hypothetical protein